MKDGALVVEEVKKIASNKWVWLGGAALVAVYFGYSYFSQNSGSSSASTTYAAPAATDPYAYLPISSAAAGGVTGGTASGTDTTGASALQALMDFQTTQANGQLALANTQAADNYALGQQSLANNLSIANINAGITNNANLVGAVETAITSMNPKNSADLSAAASFGNGSLALNVANISKNPKQNKSLISSVSNGMPMIALPSGGSLYAMVPTAAKKQGY